MQDFYDIHNSLGHLTGLASRLFNNLLVSRFHEAGIEMTAEQWGAIVVLMTAGPMSQSELGNRLFLDKSSISRLINGLEKRGWIERRRDTKDNRMKVVTVTDAALALTAQCSTIAMSVLADAEKGMSQDQLEAQKRGLAAIISNLRPSTS